MAIIINCVLRDMIIFIAYVNFRSSCARSGFALFLVTFFFSIFSAKRRCLTYWVSLLTVYRSARSS